MATEIKDKIENKRKRERLKKKERKGAIAQLVVRRADNAKVPGSKPGSTNFSFYFSLFTFFLQWNRRNMNKVHTMTMSLLT